MAAVVPFSGDTFHLPFFPGFPRFLRLGGAHCGRGSPPEERRIVAIQSLDQFFDQSSVVDHGNAAPKFLEGTVGVAAFYHA